MADKWEGRPPLSYDHGEPVHPPRCTFELMAALIQACPDEVSLMLLLLARMDSEGRAKIEIEYLPRFCCIDSQRISRAMTRLSELGWLDAVNEDAKQDGIFDCVIRASILQPGMVLR